MPFCRTHEVKDMQDALRRAEKDVREAIKRRDELKSTVETSQDKVDSPVAEGNWFSRGAF